MSKETAPTPSPITGIRTLKILVAEDNEVNQAVIKAMLLKAGHRIDMVENGLEAVAAVANTRYDLVLMDMQMPEMDGVTATRKIRALQGDTATVPIIAVTANTMNGDREKYLAAGMSDYVAKPIDPMELAAAIARQCGAPAATVHGQGRKRNATGFRLRNSRYQTCSGPWTNLSDLQNPDETAHLCAPPFPSRFPFDILS